MRKGINQRILLKEITMKEIIISQRRKDQDQGLIAIIRDILQVIKIGKMMGGKIKEMIERNGIKKAEMRGELMIGELTIRGMIRE